MTQTQSFTVWQTDTVIHCHWMTQTRSFTEWLSVTVVTCEARRNIPSVTWCVPATIEPRATPGKIYALLPCPGYIVLPSSSTGSNGLPLANIARPYITHHSVPATMSHTDTLTDTDSVGWHWQCLSVCHRCELCQQTMCFYYHILRTLCNKCKKQSL